jgi:hypothetical protein
MTLANFISIALAIFAPFIPLWAVIFVVACFIFGIFFAMVVLFLRRV